MKDEYKLMLEASKVLGQVGVGSTERFVKNFLEWLAQTLGDVHLEFLKGVGWQVGTCREELAWKGWIPGETLVEVLAKAVLYVKGKE